MEMMTSWERNGLERGRQEGMQAGVESLIVRQIRRRFGAVADSVAPRLDQLTSDQLSDLGEDLLDFTSPADLEQWLTKH